MGSLLLPIGTLASLIWDAYFKRKSYQGKMEKLFKGITYRYPAYHHRYSFPPILLGSAHFFLILIYRTDCTLLKLAVRQK